MARTSPPNPTSPMITVRGSMGRSRKLEAIAVATPKSTAGSVTRIPPATFRVHVLAMEMKSDPLLENGDEQSHPIDIKAGCDTPWHGQG